MPWIRRGLALLGALLLVSVILLGPEFYKGASEDPAVWNRDVEALAKEAASAPPGAIFFVGSSSIRLWDDIAPDLAPIPVAQMGFGGAKIGDALHHLDALLLDHPARAAVFYIGSNDLTGILTSRSKEPDEVVAVWEEIVARIRARQPGLPIYYLALKPTVLGRETWPKAAEVNRRIAALAAADPAMHFIDANAGLVLPDGEPDPDKLAWDGLHLSREGYVAWAVPIRERLLRDGLGTPSS